MKLTDTLRNNVLNKIADGGDYIKIGRVTYIIEGKKYHIKVKSGISEKYPFNINDTVLSADFEVYICGNDKTFFVIPIDIIKKMYDDPSAMPDYTHPGYTIIDVYPRQNKIIYGRGGKSIPIDAYRYYPSNIPGDSLIKKKYGSRGEGKEHKELKNCIANNPNFINVRHVLKMEIETHQFPSNDLPDIVFICSNHEYVIVEIETDNLFPGAYQLVKYRALLAAELDFRFNYDKIRVVLVAWSIPEPVKQFCDKNKIEYFCKN